MHKTLLMEVIEEELRMSLPRWLREKARAGWTQREIAEQLGVTQGTISLWMGRCGLQPRQLVALAWEHDLVSVAHLAPARPRGNFGRHRLRAV